MIYITGDTHGSIDFKKLEEFNQSMPRAEADYMIILGDVGVAGNEEHIKKYSELDFTSLFLDGNHENFTALNNYPEEEWNGGKIHRIAPGLIHLMRGQIYNIQDGKRTVKIATMGGGDSRDKEIRILNEERTGVKTWWGEEQITDEDIIELERNAKEFGSKVDYFLSHVPSATLKVALGKRPTRSDYMVREAINRAKIEATQYICGHEHIDYENNILSKHYRILYNKVYRLD